MDSARSPSDPLDDVLVPIVRSARGLSALRDPGEVGTAVRGARRLAADLGVAASRRVGAAEPAVAGALPWGVWPREIDDDLAEALASGLDPALARYAAAMRRRRRRTARRPAPRVLPLLVRRRGATARGEGTAPGGLVLRCVPSDQPVPPLDARLDRDAAAVSVRSATETAASTAPSSPTAPRDRGRRGPSERRR